MATSAAPVKLLLIASALLTLAALFAEPHAREALLAVGGAARLSLFTGIHDAWDAVAYHVLVRR